MSRTGRWIVGGIIGVLAIGAVGRLAGAQESTVSSANTVSAAGSPSPAPSTTTATSSVSDPATTAQRPQDGVVVAVVDGDTVRVRPLGSGAEQRVRLIGIDAPETGTCEATAATAALQALVLNRTVTLTMGGDGEDLDLYGRALRYIDTTVDNSAGATDRATAGDAGLAMIAGGHAIARYDSRDGYGRHDREDRYLAADAASSAAACLAPVPTTTRTTEERPIPGADDDTRVDRRTTTTPEPAGATYPNCAAAKAAGAAPLYAGEPDYSAKLDRDGDGVACE